MENLVLAGRYELRRRLGRGGMAEVWESRDTVLGRTVAVKTVDLATMHDPTLGERLHREARATAALTHPAVVTVYDAGVDAGTAFLVMELLHGRDLGAVLRDGPLPVDEALRIAHRVAGALAAAHTAGIVHRDVKPGNVIVDGHRVTVVDFGIAAVEQQVGAGLTAAGTAVGTAEYMAPEQSGNQGVTPATDVYALGCLLTALLTGRPPFSAPHPMAVLRAHLDDAPPRLADRRPEVPAELDALVAALLAKEPTDRPSARTVEAALARLRGEPADEPVTARLAVPPTPTADDAAEPPAGPSDPDWTAVVEPPAVGGGTRTLPTGPAPSDGRRRWMVLAVTLVLAVAGGTWALWPDEDRTAEPQPTASPTVTASPGPTPAPTPTTEPPTSEAPPETEPAEPEPTTAPETVPPAEEPQAEEPPAADDPIAEYLAGLPTDPDLRAGLLQDWDQVVRAVERDDQEEASNRTQDLLRRTDDAVRDGRLDPIYRDILTDRLLAVLGPAVLFGGGVDDEN